MAKKKTTAQLKKKLQPIFNRWIRLRDCGDEGGTNCIACGRWFKFEDLQAGHFHPVSAYDYLRFNEDNVNAECCGCNGFDKFHLVGYAVNLRNKIGEERYDILRGLGKATEFNAIKFYRSELEELIVYYQQELNILESKYL